MKEKKLRKLRRLTPKPAALVLLGIGVVLIAVCAPLAAHYSSKTGAWFDVATRHEAAYRDALKEETAHSSAPVDLARVESLATDRTWSSRYDLPSTTSNQRTANIIGMFGVLGFFLFIAGIVVYARGIRAAKVVVEDVPEELPAPEVGAGEKADGG